MGSVALQELIHSYGPSLDFPLGHRPFSTVSPCGLRGDLALRQLPGLEGDTHEQGLGHSILQVADSF